ncbi:MAG: Gfo/Idh/MocA family oxidoreductase [Planctomycetota bacterium]
MSLVKPIGVGILGLGRSGMNIHGDAIRQSPVHYCVKAVYDPIAERCTESAHALDANACNSVQELLSDDDIELVIVASSNADHAPQAIRALNAGKHVLCEKPFGLTLTDVDAMMEASKINGKLLQPFQQRRYEPDFLKVKQVCDSGRLGSIELIRICWHGFKRRWDWQTLTAMSGGALNNNGPHPIDHAMQLFGESDPKVWCEMKHCLCSGDAEDYLKIILYGDGPTIEIELIDVAAYAQDRWWICGKAGALRGDANRLEWKWVEWSTMPARPVSSQPTPDRSYNQEDLTWHTDSWEPELVADVGGGAAPATQPTLDLYAGLYAAIRDGKPQQVTAESVRRNVQVMEKCRAAAAHIGWPGV